MMRTGYRWSVLTSEVWTLKGLASGASLRIDRNVEGRAVSQTVTVGANGEATWTAPPEPGAAYVAHRESSTEPYQPVGVIEVRTLVDADEEQLRTEVADLDRRILALESGHVQVQGADGMGLTRVALPGLRKQRAYALARLRDYQRRRAGLSMARLT